MHKAALSQTYFAAAKFAHVQAYSAQGSTAFKHDAASVAVGAPIMTFHLNQTQRLPGKYGNQS